MKMKQGLAIWAAALCWAWTEAGSAPLLFIAAAAIGVMRLGIDRDGSLIARLADIHRIAGTFGGTAAMMCLVYDVLGRRAVWMTWQNEYLGVAVIGLAATVAVPRLIVPIFAL